MPDAATISEIARFLIEEHKPSLGQSLRAMPDEEVGTSIIEAVSERFPDWRPDDLAHALLLAQEVETADAILNYPASEPGGAAGMMFTLADRYPTATREDLDAAIDEAVWRRAGGGR